MNIKKKNEIKSDLEKLLDLEKAFNSILKDDKRGDNPIPDPLRFSYFSLNNKDVLGELSKNIKNGEYEVKPLLTIDVPKGNFTIRPMARPEIQDWIIYQALIDYLVPQIINKVSKRSFSILNFKNPKSRIDPWKKFDEKNRQLYQSGYLFVVSTDISAYFENIDLNELRKKLVNHISSNNGRAKEIIDFLFNKFLIPWSSGRVKGFGLPQGPTASTFLGDVYLDNIDREMENEKGYLRYMDDIRIWCKSEVEAKKALIKIIKSLRKYKLNINAKKTKILKYKEIEKELFDPKKSILDSVQDAFNSKNIAKIQTIIPILVNDIFKGGFSDKNPFDKRHINFANFRLSLLKMSGVDFDDKTVINLIIQNFTNKPQHADDFCSFLALYPRNEKIANFLLKFLFSKENIYEWQELHVLRALLEIEIKINKNFLKKFYKRFQDKNRHWANRSLYCLLIGKYGKNTDRELLIDEFDSAEFDELRKNIILSVQELGIASRNDFYKKASGKIWSQVFVQYVKNLKQPMYFLPYDRIKIKKLKELEAKYFRYW
jgi:hypothetical protein